MWGTTDLMQMLKEIKEDELTEGKPKESIEQLIDKLDMVDELLYADH